MLFVDHATGKIFNPCQLSENASKAVVRSLRSRPGTKSLKSRSIILTMEASLSATLRLSQPGLVPTCSNLHITDPIRLDEAVADGNQLAVWCSISSCDMKELYRLELPGRNDIHMGSFHEVITNFHLQVILACHPLNKRLSVSRDSKDLNRGWDLLLSRVGGPALMRCGLGLAQLMMT